MDNKENTEELKKVWGWTDALDAANDVFSSIHRRLLEGDLVFAYLETKPSDFHQIVIVSDLDFNGNKLGTYSIGMVTTGYTMLVPHVSIEYIKESVLPDLDKYKIDKKAKESFLKIIDNEQ